MYQNRPNPLRPGGKISARDFNNLFQQIEGDQKAARVGGAGFPPGTLPLPAGPPRLGYNPVRAYSGWLGGFTQTANTLTANSNRSLNNDTYSYIAGYVDGVDLAVGDRILFNWNRDSDGAHTTGNGYASDTADKANGIYEVIDVGDDGTTGAARPWILQRAYDAADDADFVAGYLVAVSEGNQWGKTLWRMTTTDTITLNETPIEFGQQPKASLAKIRLGCTQCFSLTDVQTYTVKWYWELVDTDDYHDADYPHYLTAPQDGFYQVTARVALYNASATDVEITGWLEHPIVEDYSTSIQKVTVPAFGYSFLECTRMTWLSAMSRYFATYPQNEYYRLSLTLSADSSDVIEIYDGSIEIFQVSRTGYLGQWWTADAFNPDNCLDDNCDGQGSGSQGSGSIFPPPIGSGSGGPSNCCQTAGSLPALVGTLSNETGDYVALPATIDFVERAAPYQGEWVTAVTPPELSYGLVESGEWFIYCESPDGRPTLRWYDASGGFRTTQANSGWTCSPRSFVFAATDGINGFTLTVVE